MNPQSLEGQMVMLHLLVTNRLRNVTAHFDGISDLPPVLLIQCNYRPVDCCRLLDRFSDRWRLYGHRGPKRLGFSFLCLFLPISEDENNKLVRFCERLLRINLFVKKECAGWHMTDEQMNSDQKDGQKHQVVFLGITKFEPHNLACVSIMRFSQRFRCF